MSTNGGQIQALDTTCRILQTMETGEFVSVTAVADEIGVSKGTVHNHLSTLVKNGLVVREEGEYRLGLRLYEIGTKVQDSYQPDAVARTLNQLSEERGTRTHFVVEQYDRVFCIHASGSVGEHRSERPYIRTPLHHTAPGKAILSAYPTERRQSYIERHNTELEHIEQPRDRAYTIGRSLLADKQFQSIATVVEQDNEIIGAVSLVFDPSEVEIDEVRTDYSNYVRRAANEIAVNLTLVK